MKNVFTNQKHEGCQDSQCAKGDENIAANDAGNEAISKDEILRSAQNDSGREIQKYKSKVVSSEMCPEHGVPESACSLCNLLLKPIVMKNS